MLELIPNKNNKRNWVLVSKGDGEGEQICELQLMPSSITNKFSIVAGLLEEMNDLVPEFSDWYANLLKTYIESSYNSEIILESTDDILEYVSRYIDAKGVDFNSFSRIEKSSKTSIMFLAEDIKALATASTALKIYSIIAYDSSMSLPSNLGKEVYEKLVGTCIELGTTTKLFQLIRSRVYRSSITDRYMWDLIKIMMSETPESYVMTIFNFLMNNMLSTIEVTKNPVPFLVSLIDDSIRWMMRTVYKDKILYGEAFGGTEDIHGSTLSKESFYVYCCNDVLGKAAKAGMSLLENEYNLTGRQFDSVRDRIDAIDLLTPPMKLVLLPIASKVLEIPYKFLLTAPPKHVLLTGIFLHYIGKNTLDERFPIINEFLTTCPLESENAFSSTRSVYRIRNLEFILNDKTPVFGFNSKTLKYDIMSSLCGVLSASKKNLVSTVSGEPMTKISYLNLEHDVIQFFTLLYSNQLDETFTRMREKANPYF
ncbi:MAG: hypothetical protein KAS32_15510 [Candidatus Peribacteraceae bacterium]|nr:hypothetical protein [Candidatus Peribacteraceae bacterium]